MQQIAEWLEKLGMSKYAQRFAENRIDFSVLSDLTDQHLKEIGVSLGHRLQLMRAIAELTSAEKDAPKAAVSTGGVRCPAGHRRTPLSHGDVLGPRRLDSAVGANGP